VKKDWNDAFFHLEALFIFMDFENSWPSKQSRHSPFFFFSRAQTQHSVCDDGERVEITDKVYGASLVTVLRALKKEERLDVANFPSLETLLKTAADWGTAMKGQATESNYHRICQAIGKRLFENKSAEVMAMEKARLEEWIQSLDEKSQKKIRQAMEDNASEEDVEKPWYHAGNIADEDDKDKNYTLSRVWKEYKACLSLCPNVPLRGPPTWDVSNWTEEDKAPFKF
jgi:hypothetical protein